MGLDNFKTSSSSSTSEGNSNSTDSTAEESAEESNQRLEDHNVTSEKVDIMPWFTAVWDENRQEVVIFKESQAFVEEKTPDHQRFLVNIVHKREYSRIRGQIKGIKHCTVKELFEQDREYAVELIERLKSDEIEDFKEECPVCGEDLLKIGDSYVEINGRSVHSQHNISEVEKKVKVEG